MTFITPAEANERLEKAPLNKIILELRAKMLKDHDAREGKKEEVIQTNAD